MAWPVIYRAKKPAIPSHIQQQLDHPVDPEGRPVEWEHPYLVFLAEHGRIPSSREQEAKAVRVFKTGRAVSKSTSMVLSCDKSTVLRSGLIIPPARPRWPEGRKYEEKNY